MPAIDLPGGQGGGGGAGPVGPQGPAGAAAGSAAAFDTYTGLRTYTPANLTAPVVAATLGAATATDQGGGMFDWVLGARPTQDNMTVIYHDTLTTGYWKRRWDGRTADLAWAGLAVGAGTAALQTAINAMTGDFILVDKLYTGVNDLTIPAGTRLRAYQPEVGFVLAAAATSNLLILAAGAEIRGLTLDGNAANAGAPGFGAALVRTVASGTRPNVEGCILRNAKTNGVYARNQETGVRVFGCTFDTLSGYGVFTQVSSNVMVKDNIIRGTGKDGIKIHGRDGVNTTYVSKNAIVRDNLIDYTGVTITATCLGIELWGGVQNAKCLSNVVYGPEAASTGFTFGISMDATEYCVIAHNTVDDRGLGKVGYGLEGAHARHCVYDGNIVRGFNTIGFSLSQPIAGMNKIVNNVIRDARDPANCFGLQLVSGGTNLAISGNTFVDAGVRAIFLNGSGSFSNISGNTFMIERQAQTMAILYVSGTVTNCVFSGNNAFNQLNNVAVAEQSTTAYCRLDLSGAVGWTVTGNHLDGNIKGALATFAVTGIEMTGSAGSNIVQGNQVINYNGVSIRTTAATGPSNTIVYNKTINSTAPAVRSTGNVDIYVAG